MSHLTTFKLRLIAESPVFMGQGVEINKKEYLYFPREQKAAMIDLPKFVGFLDSRGLMGDYEKFMLGSESDLRVWLEKTVRGSIPHRDFISYELYSGDALDENHSLSGIQLFIKDKQGRPYIPGSSLKGALRTAILSRMLSERRGFAQQCIDTLCSPPTKEGRNAYLRETEDIESRLLNTLNLNQLRRRDAVNSVMKGISISDSAPIPTSALVLCRKIDLSKNGTIKKVNVCRECLRPGSEVEFDVTIDNIIARESGITKEYLRGAVRVSAQIQNRQYAKFQKPQGFVSSPAPDGCELFLGGGAGFVSKTFVYAMDEDRALRFVAGRMKRMFPRHYHESDEAESISPHMLKCTSYNRRIYQMGRCWVVF